MKGYSSGLQRLGHDYDVPTRLGRWMNRWERRRRTSRTCSGDLCTALPVHVVREAKRLYIRDEELQRTNEWVRNAIGMLEARSLPILRATSSATRRVGPAYLLPDRWKAFTTNEVTLGYAGRCVELTLDRSPRMLVASSRSFSWCTGNPRERGYVYRSSIVGHEQRRPPRSIVGRNHPYC